jgi:hypothetical protein
MAFDKKYGIYHGKGSQVYFCFSICGRLGVYQDIRYGWALIFDVNNWYSHWDLSRYLPGLASF